MAEVSRERAAEVAEAYVRDGEGWSDIKGILAVVSWDEITWRKPHLPDQPVADSWIVYLDRVGFKLWSSTILLISKESGQIEYSGLAGDRE